MRQIILFHRPHFVKITFLYQSKCVCYILQNRDSSPTDLYKVTLAEEGVEEDDQLKK